MTMIDADENTAVFRFALLVQTGLCIIAAMLQ